MRGNVRDFFPGGNTPKGFYSYYRYIADQRESESVVCIKGGPGTGKSTFMKTIAEYFLNKGEDVDCFWCSSDPDSLDAIMLRNRHIVFMDGTSPHVMDPQNPGAVDTILHLGEYWDTSSLKNNKNHILESNETIKQWFGFAYKNLEAAALLRSVIKNIYNKSRHAGEMYKTFSEILCTENAGRPVTIAEGKCRKYFASAITYKGNLSHMNSLIGDYRKLYLISAPVGFDMNKITEMVTDAFVHRGYCVEQYYCPMEPDDKIDHILIPELKTAFLTLNDYHDMESWESEADTVNIDMREFIDWNSIEKYRDVITACESDSSSLIERAIAYLGKAKQEHDILEEYYISNMNFGKIEKLTDEWICKIEHNEV